MHHICCIQFAKQSCHCDTSGNPSRLAYGCWNGRFARNVHLVARGVGNLGRLNAVHDYDFLSVLRSDCILVGKRNCCYCTLDIPSRRRCCHDCFGRVLFGHHPDGHFAQIDHRDRSGQTVHRGHFYRGRCSVHHFGRQNFVLLGPSLAEY